MAYKFSLFQIILLSSSLIIKSTIAQQPFSGTISPDCLDRCGNIPIPYPFGVGSNCAFNSSFLINCNKTSFPNKPFLSIFNLEVLEFGRNGVQVRIPPDSNLLFENTDNFVAALDWALSGTCTGNPRICGPNAYCVQRTVMTQTARIGSSRPNLNCLGILMNASAIIVEKDTNVRICRGDIHAANQRTKLDWLL
ncbi:hypothetical protein LguiA_026271 [Lonicera macranthoides]